MQNKQFTRLILRAIPAAMLSILFTACNSGLLLHANWAALAKGDYSQIADSAVAEMVRSAIDKETADWTSGDINKNGEPLDQEKWMKAP